MAIDPVSVPPVGGSDNMTGEEFSQFMELAVYQEAQKNMMEEMEEGEE